MGEQVKLQASDGFEPGGYLAKPDGQARGGIVVVQEIFGVNQHIREVCDRFAAEGYAALAPALFDRMEPGFESGYSPEEVDRARSFLKNPDFDAFMRDTDAAKERLQEFGPIAVVGFCLGGSIAFTAATRLDGYACTVGYYGGRIAAIRDEKPKCPVQLHFGNQDKSIPMEDVEAIREARPDVEVHVYDAGHGFNCDHREAYAPEAAKVAWERTTAFLAMHMA